MRVSCDVVRRVVIISSASASGKTTLGRELAGRLDVPFHRVRRAARGNVSRPARQSPADPSKSA